MRLTADIVSSAPARLNPALEWELELRGRCLNLQQLTMPCRSDCIPVNQECSPRTTLLLCSLVECADLKIPVIENLGVAGVSTAHLALLLVLRSPSFRVCVLSIQFKHLQCYTVWKS